MNNRLFNSEIAFATLGYNDLRIKMIAIDQSGSSSGDSTPVHTHDFYEFYLLTKGAQYASIQDHEFLLQENEFVFVPPFVEHGHRHHAKNGDKGILVRFSLSPIRDADCMSIANNFIQTLSIPHCCAFKDDVITRMLTEIPEDLLQYEFYLHIIHYILRLKYVIENDKNFVLKNTRTEPICDTDLVKRVVVSITTDYMRDMNVSSLADQHNISYRHLARLFTANTGYTLTQFTVFMRLRNGIRLLRRTNLPIKEIAHRCGFHSEFYFSNSFTKAVGCSPTAFRQAHGSDTYLPPIIARFQSDMKRWLNEPEYPEMAEK